ncbi:hypothetical protein ACOQFB_03440 [Anaeromyxobacter sp. Red801]|uniref:hypothetical protein n=1 Tax=Anaeromyxobacter sp. Red801 TaxID=3411632 RepID=UPI003BA22F6F
MLATVAALHLVLAAPGTLLAQANPGDAPFGGNPPLPEKGKRSPAPPPGAMLPPPPPPTQDAPAGTPTDAPPPEARPAPAPAPARPPPVRYEVAPAPAPAAAASPGAARAPLRSLLSAEPLGGGSAVEVEAGWPSLGAMYGQGLTRIDDLGALASLDWAKTELRLGGWYRRGLGRSSGLDVAARLAVAWYANFGGTWIDSKNHTDRGLEVAPGLAFSRRAGGGVASALGELPLVFTVRHDAGLLFLPRVTFAYEAPFYGDFTLGARAGVGVRAGAGDAPLKETRGELTFLIVGGFRAF